MSLTTKHYLWIGNLLVMGVVVWSAVSFGLSIYAHRSAPDTAVTGPSDSDGPGRIRTASLTQYEDLSRSGLFGAQKSAPAPEVAGTPDEPSVVKSSGDFRLRGTVAGDTGYQAAIFENTSTNEQAIYRVGEKVGDAVLVKVDRDGAVIRRDGQEIALDIYEDETASAGQAPPSPLAPPRPDNDDNGQIARMVGPNSYIIDRDALSRQLNDLNSILSQVVIRPVEVEGGSGFQLASIRRGSLPEKLGFNRGDIITSINGVPVGSPEDLVNLYQQLGQLDSANVEIQRQGRPVALTFTFR